MSCNDRESLYAKERKWNFSYRFLLSIEIFDLTNDWIFRYMELLNEIVTKNLMMIPWIMDLIDGKEIFKLEKRNFDLGRRSRLKLLSNVK